MCVINLIRYNKLYKHSIDNEIVIYNSRLKYLRKNFNYFDNNIILFLDESLKIYRYIENLKTYQLLYMLILYTNFILKKQISNIKN